MTTPKDLARAIREFRASQGIDQQAVRELVELLGRGQVPDIGTATADEGAQLLGVGRAYLEALALRPGDFQPDGSPTPDEVAARAEILRDLRASWPAHWTDEALARCTKLAAFVAEAQHATAGSVDADLSTPWDAQ